MSTPYDGRFPTPQRLYPPPTIGPIGYQAVKLDIPVGGRLADTPTGSNWEVYISETGDGTPTSLPAEWTPVGAFFTTSQTSAQTYGDLGHTWAIGRYRTGGSWTAWSLVFQIEP